MVCRDFYGDNDMINNTDGDSRKELCFKCGEIKNCRKYFEYLCEDCYKKLYNQFNGIKAYRFVSPKVFFSMLEKQELTFKLPSAWEDSFEEIIFKLFLDARDTCLIDPIHVREILAQRDTYYCQCWTLTDESSFFWHEYGYNNSAIRLEVDLSDIFDMGLRIEFVNYQPFLNECDWIKNSIDNGTIFAQGNETDIFRVDEDGYYDGNPQLKTGKMCYIEYVISTMYSLNNNREYDLEQISLPKILATKQLKYKQENEVRFFAKFYDYNQSDNFDYLKAHNNYSNQVFNFYNLENANFQSEMPITKPISYSRKQNLIKSILCHPNMSECIFEDIVCFLKKHNLFNIFIGKSTLHVE